MRMQESTVNIFILDKSSVAVVSGLGVVKHGNSRQHSNVSLPIPLEVVDQIG